MVWGQRDRTAGVTSAEKLEADGNYCPFPLKEYSGCGTLERRD